MNNVIEAGFEDTIARLDAVVGKEVLESLATGEPVVPEMADVKVAPVIEPVASEAAETQLEAADARLQRRRIRAERRRRRRTRMLRARRAGGGPRVKLL